MRCDRTAARCAGSRAELGSRSQANPRPHCSNVAGPALSALTSDAKAQHVGSNAHEYLLDGQEHSGAM
jgi:hypothetical protein